MELQEGKLLCLNCFVSFLNCFSLLEMKPRPLYIHGKYSATELYTTHSLKFFISFKTNHAILTDSAIVVQFEVYSLDPNHHVAAVIVKARHKIFLGTNLIDFCVCFFYV